MKGQISFWRTTDSPTGLQESVQPCLRLDCRGNTESWDWGRNLVRDFLHGAGNSTWMPEIPPNAAETGLSIIPNGRVAVPGGGSGRGGSTEGFWGGFAGNEAKLRQNVPEKGV